MANRKNCILIIDDDFFNREVLKNIFAAEFVFEEAENGYEGLQKVYANKNKLCAILLDVNMPVMSGIEVLHTLHEQDITSNIPVFLVTADNESEIAKEAYEYGVMDVINKPIVPFVIQKRVRSIIELFKNRAALQARVVGQEKQLQESAHVIDALHKSTIEALATAIEFRDVESGLHTRRIYDITKYILENTEMGDSFTDQEIESIAIGAIMHDIGKIAIPDGILNKPARLTAEEFEIMKGHTVKGGQLMEYLSNMQAHDSYIYACDIARHHHERWDGKGYPDGLVGDEITVWSQVVSIADVYDALVSPRVYKSAYDPDKAVEMIVGGECGAFNPKLIECFLQVEKEIRRWYLADQAGETVDVHEKKQERKERRTLAQAVGLAQNTTEVLLLMATVKSAYDLILFADLTKNSYYMLDYDRFVNHTARTDGVFDDLIAGGVSTVPDEEKDAFIGAFSRENLLNAFAAGKKVVNLRHKQYDDNGNLHLMETSAMLMRDPATGDLIDITTSRCVDSERV